MSDKRKQHKNTKPLQAGFLLTRKWGESCSTSLQCSKGNICENNKCRPRTTCNWFKRCPAGQYCYDDGLGGDKVCSLYPNHYVAPTTENMQARNWAYQTRPVPTNI
jgi:hypothetical protein